MALMSRELGKSEKMNSYKKKDYDHKTSDKAWEKSRQFKYQKILPVSGQWEDSSVQNVESLDTLWKPVGHYHARLVEKQDMILIVVRE